MSPPKRCAVCGDKALGYNFNAVTCESCKAFFRRNALAQKQFTCPFSQNCEITVVTRRFCQKCRLKKCLDIGMKSENIMSEEDKLIKRRKIESNREKRRLGGSRRGAASSDGDATSEMATAAADSSGFGEAYAVSDSQHSSGSYDSAATGPSPSSSSGGGGCSAGGPGNGAQPSSSTTIKTVYEPIVEVNPALMTAEEMVEFIVCDADKASQAISKLMRSKKEAMACMETIIRSQKDALKLISHLIAFPGDALKIISKLMNSPFNALTVFTKFMSSPTDAVEIISKIVSSPQDVLEFMKNLVESPEDALDIMNKFMNTPKEALQMLNKIFNGQHDTPPKSDEFSFHSPLPPPVPPVRPPPEEENALIHAMLSSPNSAPTPLPYPLLPSPQPDLVSTLLPPPGEPMAMTSELNYASPNSQDELPSTSSVAYLPASPPPSIETAGGEFAHDDLDIKAFILNAFPDNGGGGGLDSINSLESVLTEVIRIEFQAFNNLPPEGSSMGGGMEAHDSGYGACNMQQQQRQMQEQHLQQQPICAPSSVVMGRDLNETEHMKIRELRLASEALYYPVDDDLSVLMMNDDRMKSEDTHQDPKLLQVINLTAVAIKRLIKMAKKITAFRDMCQEDQVALLKGGCTEMMIMRSVMTYDDNRNTWKIPHTKEDMSNIHAEVLKLAKGNVYEELVKFVTTFDEKWRLDENIILIMCAIVLFSPKRSRVIHADVIRLEQKSYYYLLRRYLESVYPGCEAKSAYIKLIEKISDVERLNQFIIGVYLNVNPAQVEPLLREIFDLKNH